MFGLGDSVIIKIAYPQTPLDKMIDGQIATIERTLDVIGYAGRFAVRLNSGATVQVTEYEIEKQPPTE